MALVFFDWFLIFYKPVNARGARSFELFSLFCGRLFRNETGNENNDSLLLLKIKTLPELNSINSPIVVYTSENAISAERKIATVLTELRYHSEF